MKNYTYILFLFCTISVYNFYAQKEKVENVRLDGFYESVDYNANQVDSIVLFSTKPFLLAGEIKNISSDIDQFGNHFLLFEFNEFGAAILARYTTKNIGKPIGIFIHNKLVSSAFVNSPIIRGKLSLTGNYTQKEAAELLQQINKFKRQ